MTKILLLHFAIRIRKNLLDVSNRIIFPDISFTEYLKLWYIFHWMLEIKVFSKLFSKNCCWNWIITNHHISCGAFLSVLGNNHVFDGNCSSKEDICHNLLVLHSLFHSRLDMPVVLLFRYNSLYDFVLMKRNPTFDQLLDLVADKLIGRREPENDIGLVAIYLSSVFSLPTAYTFVSNLSYFGT